ncbi:MAG: hypothetical protein WBN22_13335 [Verrucomicrobiia bacterium]
MEEEMFDKLVAERQARIRNLEIKREDLQRKAEAARPKPQFTPNQDRYLTQLDDKERELERDIAIMEGRHPDDDDDHQEPMPPEDRPDA